MRAPSQVTLRRLQRRRVDPYSWRTFPVHKKAAHRDLLNSDATRRSPAGRRRPPISVIPMAPRPLLTVEPVFFRLGRFLRFPPPTNAVRPGRIDQPLATLPLPRPLSGHISTQGRSDMNPGENSRPLPTTPSSPSSFTPKKTRIWYPIDPPSPNNDSQQPAAAMQPSTGEHGVDRSFFCL
ncbi:hypothetical protein CY34DRAFT_18205 [Suillus luteus UH-Slu-Lm8-n1]|uniref:Uncharacterized protein n=1 Tax=Suillus luteus UH-Slu-Lm8-n1 TaxID=930992 RepID=A0A0C9ZW88_9AGAM|nr:hypothetical protein CY34DRAFT_18205 [Suillus luteus UH-Slu-Lm8-n1]